MSLAGKDADRKKQSHQGAEDFNQLEVMGEKQHIEVYECMILSKRSPPPHHAKWNGLSSAE